MPFIIMLHDSSVCCGSPWETLVLRGCGVHGALPSWPPVGLGIVCPAALTSACACGAGECLSSRLSGELTSIHISPEPSLKRANPTACGVSLGQRVPGLSNPQGTLLVGACGAFPLSHRAGPRELA